MKSGICQQGCMVLGVSAIYNCKLNNSQDVMWAWNCHAHLFYCLQHYQHDSMTAIHNGAVTLPFTSPYNVV
jgi:hypothetical protein